MFPSPEFDWWRHDSGRTVNLPASSRRHNVLQYACPTAKGNGILAKISRADRRGNLRGEDMKSKKYLARIGAFSACLVSLAPLHAQTLPDPAVPPEIAEIYSSFCLQKFPDLTALGALASTRKAAVLDSTQVKRFLHSDPGRGWALHTGTGNYIILAEDPPFRTCSVRRMTPSGIADVKPYIAAVNAYIAAQNGKLIKMQPSQSKTPDGIADVTTLPYGMLNSAGKPSETFAVFLTNYHGRAPEDQRADATGGVGVEVRMVHQIVQSP
jgi:hypothetical protein